MFFKLRFGAYINSNMLNSVLIISFFVLDWKEEIFKNVQHLMIDKEAGEKYCSHIVILIRNSKVNSI